MRGSELALALASLSLLLAAPVAAKEDRDGDDVALLTQADLDPGTLLPAPPAAGSTQAQAEMAELRAMEAARSEADVAAAKHDSETKNASIFADVLGPSFDLAKLPATREMFEVVRATEKDAANRGKAAFRRPRPWIVDDALKTCSRDDDPMSSYPSGHTTMAYSMGAVLARLVPAKASEIMARAAAYGQSRIVCEQHFRSDVTAGEALGLIVAERLMTKPHFQHLFEAAGSELQRAGLR
jgi:acid phosphatase (class A)